MKKILDYQKNLGLKEMQNLILSIFFILTHLIPDSCNEKKKKIIKSQLSSISLQDGY